MHRAPKPLGLQEELLQKVPPVCLVLGSPKLNTTYSSNDLTNAGWSGRRITFLGLLATLVQVQPSTCLVSFAVRRTAGSPSAALSIA